MKAERSQVLLELIDVRKYYPIQEGFLKKQVGDVKAVDRVSLEIRLGETLGLVGESGCGKTTLGRLAVCAFPPTAGRLLFHDDREVLDLARLSRRELCRYWRKAQLIFQDPYASLNPRRTVLQIIEEPLVCLEKMKAGERKERVKELLRVVGLDPRFAERYPHAFSGGQRQRIGIARALATDPEFIVADEAVSALDVSIQAQIINLLEEIQARFHLTILFISHDLGVVKHISNRVAVMYVGKLVELAETDELFTRPHHPYTEALMSAIPQPDPDLQLTRIVLKGDVADPANRPPGCSFHPRCLYAQARCREEEPAWRDVGTGKVPHGMACHFDLELKGIRLG